MNVLLFRACTPAAAVPVIPVGLEIVPHTNPAAVNAVPETWMMTARVMWAFTPPVGFQIPTMHRDEASETTVFAVITTPAMAVEIVHTLPRDASS